MAFVDLRRDIRMMDRSVLDCMRIGSKIYTVLEYCFDASVSHGPDLGESF